MLTQAENERLTQVGPGTACGALLPTGNAEDVIEGALPVGRDEDPLAGEPVHVTHLALLIDVTPALETGVEQAVLQLAA